MGLPLRPTDIVMVPGLCPPWLWLRNMEENMPRASCGPGSLSLHLISQALSLPFLTPLWSPISSLVSLVPEEAGLQLLAASSENQS